MTFGKLKIVAVLLLAGAAIAAQNNILRVAVVGNQTTDKNLILSTSGLTPGKELTSPLLESAVKKLYALGLFSDVSVIGMPTADGIILEIHIVELPHLKVIEFEGNKKFKDKELKKAINLPAGTAISEQDIFEAKKKILEKYRDKGYPKATVEADTYSSEDKNIILHFKIDEGPKARIRHIDFTGNTAFSDKKLRHQMELHQRWWPLHSGEFKEETLPDDVKKVEDFYHNNGYLEARVISDSFWYDPDKPENIHIEMAIEEGGKYYFGKAAIQGDSVLNEAQLLPYVETKTGDIYSTEKISKSVMNIAIAYQEIGYIYARVEPAKEIRSDTVYITFDIAEGKKAYVRRIEIAGNTRTFDKVIRRELTLLPGDVFKRNKLERSLRNVYFLNYFEDVTPDFKTLDSGNVDLTVKVKEKAIGQFQVGAGYNSQDKLVGTVTIGWPNVFGRGWETNLNWEFGERRNNITFSFTEPWFLDTPTTVGLDIYNTIWRWTDYYTEKKIGGAIRGGRRLSFPDDYTSVYGRYSLLQLSYYDFGASYNAAGSYDLRRRDWPQLESSASFTATRDSRNSRMFATDGSRNLYSVELTGHFLGGDIGYQKQDIHSDWYIPIFKYLVVVGKAHFTFVTDWWGNAADIPYSERLFPGGVSLDGQLRGYRDRSISPRETLFVEDSTVSPDVSGEYPLLGRRSYATGGRALAIFTVELRVPVMKDQLYLSLFADAGNAWSSSKIMRFNDLYRSAGAGVRFVIPMLGVLGVDAGYGFDRPDGPKWEYHFQIGPEN